MSKIRSILAGQSLFNNQLVEISVQEGAIEKHTTKPFFATSFDLSKELIAELPIVPINDRIYELVQDIERGAYSDISTMEEAYANWDAWVDRTREILKGRRILSNGSKLRSKIRSLK